MFRSIFLILFLTLVLQNPARAWWDNDWSARKKITIDTTAATGSEIAAPIGGATILVRLHDGNFQFDTAKGDGSDLRFVAEDDKTVLPSQVEKYDNLLNEAFVWVQVPEVKPGGQTAVWLYSGNADAAEPQTATPPYDADTALVYHFAERSAPPIDSTANKNNATTASTPSEGALIGSGARLLGAEPLALPALTNPAGGPLTWSAWIKQTIAAPDTTLFQWGDGLRIGLADGTPYVEIAGARASAPAAIALNTWAHIVVQSADGEVQLFVNGQSVATASVALPALEGAPTLGGGASGGAGFIGEIDELQIARSTRPAGAIQLAALAQGGGAQAERLVQFGEGETRGGGGHNALTEHLSLLGGISKSLTVDGWIVIVLCAILALVGWVVAIKKFIYLRELTLGNTEFLARWRNVSSDLTTLDHANAADIEKFGGSATPQANARIAKSPIYRIYYVGSEEIRDRMERKGDNFRGLSARSIQAIRASLDASLVRNVHRLNSHLVFLTIGIAGGPYLGLLGTVIGVMITFAVIAQSGEVNINSIAPGIAGALLATVAGLAVAIPALFIYSYLNARIKETVSIMQTFIDEFVTKMAESYPTAND